MGLTSYPCLAVLPHLDNIANLSETAINARNHRRCRAVTMHDATATFTISMKLTHYRKFLSDADYYACQ